MVPAEKVEEHGARHREQVRVRVRVRARFTARAANPNPNLNPNRMLPSTAERGGPDAGNDEGIKNTISTDVIEINTTI